MAWSKQLNYMNWMPHLITAQRKVVSSAKIPGQEFTKTSHWWFGFECFPIICDSLGWPLL